MRLSVDRLALAAVVLAAQPMCAAAGQIHTGGPRPPVAAARGQSAGAGQATTASAARTGRLLVTRLNVRDLAASLRFFTEGLGLSEQSRFSPSKGSIEVTIGDRSNPLPAGIMLLHRESRTTPYDPGEWGTVVLEVKDVNVSAANAARAGGKLIRPPADSPAAPVIVAVVEDPDGHQFELVQFK
ncbi:MAG TPA: VOC family protein [Vicinamibacterales bacterium]|nr:VOC family protein [Vicinamibacterales bacterium]